MIAETMTLCTLYYVLAIVVAAGIFAVAAFVIWCCRHSRELPPLVDEHDPGYEVTKKTPAPHVTEATYSAGDHVVAVKWVNCGEIPSKPKED